jgi:hypothetical protein
MLSAIVVGLSYAAGVFGGILVGMSIQRRLTCSKQPP